MRTAMPPSVAGVHDARARSSELSDCCPQFGVEPFVFQGERRGGADCLHELPLLCQAGGVDDRGDAPALVLDGCGDLSLWCRGSTCTGRPLSAST